MFGIIHGYYQKHGYDNYNDNINGIDIMNIDTAKIKLRNGKKFTIGFGIFKINNAPSLDTLCILAISLISIYATHNNNISATKNDLNI